MRTDIKKICVMSEVTSTTQSPSIPPAAPQPEATNTSGEPSTQTSTATVEGGDTSSPAAEGSAQESTSSLDEPAVEVVNRFTIEEDTIRTIREFERSIARLRDRAPDTPSPIERIREEEGAQDSQAVGSAANLAALASAQTDSFVAAQLASTLAVGLTNALSFYDSFRARLERDAFR